MKYEKSILDVHGLEVFNLQLCGKSCFGIRAWHKEVCRLNCPARFLCVFPAPFTLTCAGEGKVPG